MDLYREEILDHYKHPHNFGTLGKFTVEVTEGNVSCGDKISMQILVDKKGIVTDVRFQGVGCAISMASASLLTDKIKSMDKKDIMKLTTQDIYALLGNELTPSRTKCALLPLEVLQKAVGKAKSKK